MSKKFEKSAFKKGGQTYHYSSKLFPRNVRDDVAKVYSFVRVVRDMVDTEPANLDAFKHIIRRWQALKKSGDFGRFQAADDSVEERVLGNICYIVHRFECDPRWVDDFLRSAAMDVRAKNYQKIEDTLEYIHGSSEVVGYMAAKAMRLPNAAKHFAGMQGRAVNFAQILRDIHTNSARDRNYFPKSELKKFGLEKLDEANALKKPEEFKKFIRFQAKRYKAWQADAKKGLKFVPRRLRIPLHTTIDMYAWTVKKIEKDPFLVFDKKVTPRRSKVIRRTAGRFIRP